MSKVVYPSIRAGLRFIGIDAEEIKPLQAIRQYGSEEF